MSQHKDYYLSDEEFLRMITRQRMQSPLIDELCKRLEDLLIEKQLMSEDIPDSTTMVNNVMLAPSKVLQCPICEAKLTLSIFLKNKT